VDGSDQPNLKFGCCPALAIRIIVITDRSGKGVENMSLHIDETSNQSMNQPLAAPRKDEVRTKLGAPPVVAYLFDS
jgi:hypothetical protein